VDPKKHSVTALAAALFRAVHARSGRPRLLEEPCADRFVTADERAFIFERLLLMLDPDRREEIRGIAEPTRAFEVAVEANPAYGTIIIRSRYTEDRLADALARGVRQYVLVGAGMDTFAFRRPDLANTLQIFELDHPATQAMKRERLARARLVPPPNLHFVAVDLEEGSVAAALVRPPYRADEQAFFASLGVLPYLTREASLGMLGAIAACAAPGSEIVFDYLELDALTPDRASDEAKRVAAERADSTEPWMSGFDPDRLAADIAETGLELDEDLDGDAAARLYVAAPGARLTMVSHGHLARAHVRGTR
jgi:methyltransferase (TIGR00027 family)